MLRMWSCCGKKPSHNLKSFPAVKITCDKWHTLKDFCQNVVGTKIKRHRS